MVESDAFRFFLAKQKVDLKVLKYQSAVLSVKCLLSIPSVLLMQSIKYSIRQAQRMEIQWSQLYLISNFILTTSHRHIYIEKPASDERSREPTLFSQTLRRGLQCTRTEEVMTSSHWFLSKVSKIFRFWTRSITPLSPLSSASLVPDWWNSLCWAGRPSLKAKPAPQPTCGRMLSCVLPASWRGAGEGKGRTAQVARGVAESPSAVAPCIWEPSASHGTSPCPPPWPRSPCFLCKKKTNKQKKHNMSECCFKLSPINSILCFTFSESPNLGPDLPL